MFLKVVTILQVQLDVFFLSHVFKDSVMSYCISSILECLHGSFRITGKLIIQINFFFLFPLLSVEWVISLDKVGYIWFYFLFLNLNFGLKFKINDI